MESRGQVSLDRFFCFRTPLLPLKDLRDWSEGMESPGAAGDRLDETLARDRSLLRGRLQALVSRPEVLEAIYVSSPDLVESLPRWAQDPDGERGRRTESALVRFFSRMCHRPTPFGLFAGVTTGLMGNSTSLTLPELRKYRARARLDTALLCALEDDLHMDPQVRDHLVYRPNNSLYPCGGRLRYAMARIQASGRSYRLAVIGTDEALDLVLRCAAQGARLPELASALAGEGYSQEEALAYVHLLAQEQVLVSDLQPRITGHDTALLVEEKIRGLPEAAPCRVWGGVLGATREILENLEQKSLGSGIAHYVRLKELTVSWGGKIDRFLPWRVDLFKPSPGATLGADLQRDLMDGIRLLQRVSPPLSFDPLKDFREAFRAQYDQRWVPLAEALDPEFGPRARVGAPEDLSDSPLTKDLQARRLHGQAGEGGEDTPTRRDLYLCKRICQIRSRGEKVLELTEADLHAMASGKEPPPLPHSFVLAVELAATSGTAFQRGDCQIVLLGTLGPSSARMLGRFCHGDPQLLSHLLNHLREEESHRPEAAFAEIVHLPGGPMGNISTRPLLRRYEIPYLGRGGSPEDQWITIQDLLLGLAGDRLVLWSRSLDREVVPRLSCAANYLEGGSRLFRFLCCLQDQGVRGVMEFQWGALVREPFLPRVTMGKFVLARAHWRLTKEDLAGLAAAASPEGRYRLFQDLRRAKEWSRHLVLMDGDHQLPVDLDNPLSLDALWGALRKEANPVLREDFPADTGLVIQGPEGAFTGELLIPCLAEGGRSDASPMRSPLLEQERRLHGPGSEWLYWRIYTGTATADRLLEGPLAGLVQDLRDAGWVDRWFFLRYADPEPHLRFRFHGEPALLCSKVLPLVHEVLDPLIRTGWIRKINLDTYEPEISRYGGLENLPDAESLFQADSEAVLGIIAAIPGDEGPDHTRWPLGLVSADQWLVAAGYSLAQRMALVESWLAQAPKGPGQEPEDLRRRLGDRFREERTRLESLFLPRSTPAGAQALGLGMLQARTTTSLPILARVKERLAREAAQPGLDDFMVSIIHMGLNRLLRSTTQGEEFVVMNFLARVYDSLSHRRDRPGGEPEPAQGARLGLP